MSSHRTCDEAVAGETVFTVRSVKGFVPPVPFVIDPQWLNAVYDLFLHCLYKGLWITIRDCCAFYSMHRLTNSEGTEGKELYHLHGRIW